MAKVYYDKSYKPLILATGSIVYLRLYYGYKILRIGNRKLYYQRVESFKILKKIRVLAYRLELLLVMNIYLVVSIAQLEPTSLDEDPYARPRNINPPYVVEIENKIEVLLKKRVLRGKTQYLVKWKGYSNEYNVQYNIDNLQNAQELIAEYKERSQLRPIQRGRGRPRKDPSAAARL